MRPTSATAKKLVLDLIGDRSPVPLSDLGLHVLDAGPGLLGALRRRLKRVLGAIKPLRLPLRNLISVDIKLLGSLNQRLVATQSSYCHLGLECRGVIPAESSHRFLLLGRLAAPVIKAEIPLTALSDYPWPALPAVATTGFTVCGGFRVTAAASLMVGACAGRPAALIMLIAGAG